MVSLVLCRIIQTIHMVRALLDECRGGRREDHAEAIELPGKVKVWTNKQGTQSCMYGAQTWCNASPPSPPEYDVLHFLRHALAEAPRDLQEGRAHDALGLSDVVPEQPAGVLCRSVGQRVNNGQVLILEAILFALPTSMRPS